MLITPSDNARLVCEVVLTSHWSCLSAWRGEGSLDDMITPVSSLQPLFVHCFSVDFLHLTLPSFFLFWLSLSLHRTHIHVNLLHPWLLFSTSNLVSSIPSCHLSLSSALCLFLVLPLPCLAFHFSYAFLTTSLVYHHPFPHLCSHPTRLPHLIPPCHPCEISQCFTLTHPMFLSALLLHPSSFPSPSTHPYVDRERHVPEQDKGAARSREGQCAILPSPLGVFHLLPPLPHSCARHPRLSGRRGRGAVGPKAGRRWWWQQRQRTFKCGRGTPAPVAHLPEHHRCACSIYGYHDCRWVCCYILSPAWITSHPTPFAISVLCYYIFVCWYCFKMGTWESGTL